MLTPAPAFPLALSIALVACGSRATPPPAAADEARRDAETRLVDATRFLSELADEDAIPHEVAARSRCVVVIPGLVRGGLVVGGRHGRGVATCRDRSGSFASTLFVSLGGGSFGAQIGYESGDVIMFVSSERGAERLLASSLHVGADVSAAAGSTGRGRNATTTAKLDAEVLSYARNRGLFAGAELAGSTLRLDDAAMSAIYPRGAVASDVLSGRVAPPAETRDFLATANRALVDGDAGASAALGQ